MRIWFVRFGFVFLRGRSDLGLEIVKWWSLKYTQKTICPCRIHSFILWLTTEQSALTLSQIIPSGDQRTGCRSYLMSTDANMYWKLGKTSSIHIAINGNKLRDRRDFLRLLSQIFIHFTLEKFQSHKEFNVWVWLWDMLLLMTGSKFKSLDKIRLWRHSVISRWPVCYRDY